VGGREFVHVINFAVGSVSAVEGISIPGSFALFDVADGSRGGGIFGVPRRSNVGGVLGVFRGGVRRRSGLRRGRGGYRALGGTTGREKNGQSSERKKG
jgi:hypothetical protein